MVAATIFGPLGALQVTEVVANSEAMGLGKAGVAFVHVDVSSARFSRTSVKTCLSVSL